MRTSTSSPYILVVHDIYLQEMQYMAQQHFTTFFHVTFFEVTTIISPVPI